MGALPAGNSGVESQLYELYAQAKAAREQSRALVARLQAAQQFNAETMQRIQAAKGRAEQFRELWLAGRPGRLRYSASARLQARLESMPVIEQAKGIIMAQCGWPAEQAFDALRRASQRENVKVRDLAVLIVTRTASSARAPAADGPAGHQLLTSASGQQVFCATGTATRPARK